MSDLLIIERDGDIAVLTFNDPERRNAMTEAMGEAFSSQLAELARDDSLRCVVLTGAGRAFSAGGDFGMIQDKADRGRAAPKLARHERILHVQRRFEFAIHADILHQPEIDNGIIGTVDMVPGRIEHAGDFFRQPGRLFLQQLQCLRISELSYR